jgi:hypothetical protein
VRVLRTLFRVIFVNLWVSFIRGPRKTGVHIKPSYPDPVVSRQDDCVAHNLGFNNGQQMASARVTVCLPLHFNDRRREARDPTQTSSRETAEGEGSPSAQPASIFSSRACPNANIGGVSYALWPAQNLPTTSFHSHVKIVAPTSPSFRRTAAHTKAELKFAN